jgi:hypothetical protein
MISPTVGRKVWLRPNGSTQHDGRPLAVYSVQPLDATIIYVWGDRMVNLLVTDHGGTQHVFGSVTLVQEGDMTPAFGAYAEWMPYQKSQAKAA